MANTTLKLKGTVSKSFYDTENKKLTLGISITDKTADQVESILKANSLEYQGENWPVKQLDDGRLIYQASSRFMPELSGINEDDYSSIGIGSEVTLYTRLKAGRAMRKKYVAAYITGIQVHHFVEYTKDSVFDSEDVIEIEDNPFNSDTE